MGKQVANRGSQRGIKMCSAAINLISIRWSGLFVMLRVGHAGYSAKRATLVSAKSGAEGYEIVIF